MDAINKIGYFEIQATDVQRAIDFYSTVFGWSFTRDPHIPIEYYRIENAGLMGGLMLRDAPWHEGMKGTTNAFMCSMQVASFDETATKILEKDGKVALPKFAVPGKCWQGYFLDSENNVFGIYQPDENAK